MKVLTRKIIFKCEKETEIKNITDQVKTFIDESEIQNGLVCVFTKHTTSAIRVNEDENELRKDYSEFIEKLIPKEKDYNHDIIERRDCPPDERINGHAHLRALIMGASESIPIVNGVMTLGRWQSIFFFDLDGCDREREVIVQIIGI